MKIVGDLGKNTCPIDGVDSTQVQFLIDFGICKKCFYGILLKLVAVKQDTIPNDRNSRGMLT
jgi:hypothetical protein